MDNFIVVALDPLPEDQISWWGKYAQPRGITFKAPLSDNIDEIKSLLLGADAIIVQKRALTKDLLDSAPKVKFVQKMGRLFNKIDVSAVKARNIPMAYLPLPGCSAVAEHTIALMLACAKKIVVGHEMTVKGSYRDLGVEPKVTTERSHGFQWMKILGLEEVNGLTLGIYGYGEIGNEVARRMKAFNMEIIYHKRTALSDEDEDSLGIRYADKDSLFREADFIVCHSPLTADTENSIGKEEFKKMKKTAFLINVSRGGVINELELVDALNNNEFAGAGLDVFVEEPIPYDHPYLKLENVTLSPHIAGGKGGAKVRHTEAVLDNIKKFAYGEAPDFLA